MQCKIAGRTVTGLVDSGASLSVISENMYRRLWSNWNFTKLPMPNHLRVTGITGHTIKFVDYVLIDIEMMGKVIKRPMLVATGLEHTDMVLGWDTIMEEHMIIDGLENTVYFKDRTMKKESEWHAAALCAMTSQTIEPRSVVKMLLEPRVGTKVLRDGALGICYAIQGAPLVIWDSLTGVEENGKITMAVANFGHDAVSVKTGECVGFMKNPEFDKTEIIEGNEEFVHSMFGELGEDCKEPEKGCVNKLNKKEEQEFLSKLHCKCPDEWRQKYLDLILRFNDVFSKDKFDLGFCDVIEHKVHMKTDDPVFVKQFRVPYEHQAVLHEFVDELLKKGAIQDSKSPYNSPVFCVPKKLLPGADPKEKPPLRCVLDFRAINKHAIPQKYSMKDCRECLDDIGRGNAKIYSQIDLTSGFWQQSLAKESRPYTAFTVPGKLGAKFEWCVMPMGLQGSSSSFARLINFILRGIQGISSYIDDVLTFSDTHENQIKVLEEVFLRFRKYGLKINMAKSIFATPECQYLGFTLKQGEITTSKDKAEAIKNFPEPRTPRAVREYLGICNFFRGLIRNYHQKAEPLMKVLNSSSGWKGGHLPEDARQAFNDLKELLSSEPVLTLPVKNRQYILYTDAALGDNNSIGGMGAMLVQEDQEERQFAIGFASRALKKNEANYSAHLLEQAAVVWAIEYFEHYLKGNRFIVRCDNKPIVELSSVHKKTLSRLQEKMLEFDFDLEHTEGKNNKAADALSRNACVMALYAIDENEVSVEYAQRCCPQIGLIRKFLQSGELPEDKEEQKWVKMIAKSCYEEDGLIWHMEKRVGHRERPLLLVPKGMRRRLIEEGHCSPEAGHGGIDRTAERVMMAFWWPNLRFDCQTFVKECEICQTARSTKPAPANLIPLPITTRPNERIHLDLFGELKTSHAGNKYILVITDSFTKYTEICAIPSKSAEQVAKAFFERWLIRHAAPEVLVTDCGREFCNKVVDEVCKLWGTEKRRTTPWHPQTNSLAERYNQSIINYMKSVLSNDTTLDWEPWLPMLQLSFNTHVHRATKETPFYMIYGRDPRLPYTNFRKNRIYGQGYAAAQLKAMSEAHEKALENMKEAEEIRKSYYEKKAQERDFHIGDRILVHFPHYPTGINRKFFKQWRLCQVTAKVGPVNLRVRTLDREKGQKSEFLIHVDRCKIASHEEIEEFFDSIKAEKGLQNSETSGKRKVARSSRDSRLRAQERDSSRRRRRRLQYLQEIQDAEDQGFEVQIIRRSLAWERADAEMDRQTLSEHEETDDDRARSDHEDEHEGRGGQVQSDHHIPEEYETPESEESQQEDSHHDQGVIEEGKQVADPRDVGNDGGARPKVKGSAATRPGKHTETVRSRASSSRAGQRKQDRPAAGKQAEGGNLTSSSDHTTANSSSRTMPRVRKRSRSKDLKVSTCRDHSQETGFPASQSQKVQDLKGTQVHQDLSSRGLKKNASEGGKKIRQKDPPEHSSSAKPHCMTTRGTRSRAALAQTAGNPSLYNSTYPPDGKGGFIRPTNESTVTNRLYIPPVPLERIKDKEVRERERQKVLQSMNF